MWKRMRLVVGLIRYFPLFDAIQRHDLTVFGSVELLAVDHVMGGAEGQLAVDPDVCCEEVGKIPWQDREILFRLDEVLWLCDGLAFHAHAQQRCRRGFRQTLVVVVKALVWLYEPRPPVAAAPCRVARTHTASRTRGRRPYNRRRPQRRLRRCGRCRRRRPAAAGISPRPSRGLRDGLPPGRHRAARGGARRSAR